ncbi:MAG TPA: M1 family metallopeptidase [Terriglobia bacterium]|nr:M1 family metallopeptidase [Terriglobia bacterium]
MKLAFRSSFCPLPKKSALPLTFVVLCGLALLAGALAQTPNAPATRQETLRGAITPEREWWDVLHYDLSVEFTPTAKRIRGSNVITFKTLKPGDRMQIDLQTPLTISRVVHGGAELKYEREGNVYWVRFEKELPAGIEDKVEIEYGGRPTEARNPPWSGGITWGRDDVGEWWINTTCEGIGASIWWPNKDIGYDEPDRGMDIHVTVPDNLVDVSNGRLKGIDHDEQAKTRTFHWFVSSPINNYGVNANIGDYINWSDTYAGVAGNLDISYWVLPHQKEAAMKAFQEVPRMLKAFEYWFGKYPWYEDGYKLVTVSYPGMEHQSSVTYGNYFRNGYRDRDLSGTGIGMKFDYIIVHESAHEWFGNNISMKDAADMWIHEAFASYAENIFVEYYWGKQAGADYVIGTRRDIRNDRPIIGTYGANREGSGDMYPKGSNMLHTIRQIVNDDARWRSILQGLNRDFARQTVTTQQIESYISQQAGVDLSKVFDQYLRTTDIPLLQYRVAGRDVSFKWSRVVAGFAMPIRVIVNGKPVNITPTRELQSISSTDPITAFEVDRNYYISAEALN